MPLYKTLNCPPDVRVFIWKIEEPESWLASGIELTPHCQQRVDGMRSELHRRGFLSIRHLLAEAGYTDSDLVYDALGKPHLRDGTHISITHSFEFTGIVVSVRHQVGIDIERQRAKILRIAHRFTPIEAYRSVEDEGMLIRKVTVVWGAKESLYKVMGIPGLSFYRHLEVADFELGDGKTRAKAVFGGNSTEFEVFFREFEGYTMAYALRMPEERP